VEEDKASDIVNPNTNKTRSEEIKEIFETAINKPKVNIKTQSLIAEAQEETPPAMVLLPEAMRRFQEMTAMMQQREMKFPDEHMLVINTSHPLIENIYQLNKGAIIQGSGESNTQEMVNMMCQHVYDLALIAQRAFDAEGMTAFVERSNNVLTKLTQR